MKCDQCEHYDADEQVCGAFECNGMDCPDLPCEQWWVFTFGYEHPNQGKYVKIQGTYGQARQKMLERYGERWAFQYPWDKWKEVEDDPNRWWPIETLLEVIE